MEQEYIAAVRDAYEQFFASYTEAPVLALETDDLDLVRDPQARIQTIGLIRAALQGYRQQALIP
jgi:deoxyadenosine/deoxycytidine kinase